VYVFRNVTGGHWITAMFGSTMVTTVESNGIPTAYGLSQNYPNPFNPTTTIRFAIPKRSYVTLKVFNVLGAEIATLISQEIGPGRFSARWNADVPSGAYFYRLQASDFVETKKMLLLR